MNKKIFVVGMLLVIGGLVIFHTASSHNTSSHPSKNTLDYSDTPLFHIRLLQVDQETPPSLQFHYLEQIYTSLTIPPSNEQTLSRSTQSYYTSFHTGACVHPTSCPCITSGVFCGGKPTCGIYCVFPLVQNEYHKKFT